MKSVSHTKSSEKIRSGSMCTEENLSRNNSDNYLCEFIYMIQIIFGFSRICVKSVFGYQLLEYKVLIYEMIILAITSVIRKPKFFPNHFYKFFDTISWYNFCPDWNISNKPISYKKSPAQSDPNIRMTELGYLIGKKEVTYFLASD